MHLIALSKLLCNRSSQAFDGCAARHALVFGWLKESAAVAQLWSASLLMLRLLEKTFVHESYADRTGSEAAWRERYANAVQRLQRAGICTVEDQRAGAQHYVALRREWDADVQTLSWSMRLNLGEIDPAVARA